ncbi:Matrix-remodeling-associated protein 7 [Lonchura striata]|uniref:Matrix-remodeling-associated protein 7 n=1 Tax=Lonchura striata TaxID=40157 RepID=A0A218UAB5_9PASE|nr:Matrix-remodeling-associated protein 7 [Lonchura striata domestica]
MDLPVDWYPGLAVPLLFTVLALVLASVFLRLRGGGGQRAAEPAREGGPGGEAAPAAAKGPEDEGSRVPVEEPGIFPFPEAGAGHFFAPNLPIRVRAVPEEREEEVDSENEKLVVREPEDEDAADETFSFKYSPGKLRGNQYKSMMSKEELEEEQSSVLTGISSDLIFGYFPSLGPVDGIPTKGRGTAQKHWGQEELEDFSQESTGIMVLLLDEGSWVQREQLAAIFRLMKEKSDTFGEMSEGDMKEQLRLYDI